MEVSQVFLSPWLNLGVGGLVIFAVVFGLLVPKRSVDKLIIILESRLRDKDFVISELTKTNSALDQRNDMLADQVRLLTEVARTTNAAISALPKPERDGS